MNFSMLTACFMADVFLLGL